MSLFLGVDLGTQSVKVVVLDAETRALVAQGQAALPEPAAPRPGAAEQDPADWWRAFTAAMTETLADPAVDAGAIAGLGVSGQQHGMVALDEELNVLHPAKLWCDLEAVAEAEELSQLAGHPIPAGFTAPKLLWLSRHLPALAARLRHLALPHDWLNLQLTGALATDHGDASGIGLYDPWTGEYRSELAAAVHEAGTDILLPLREATALHGTLLPEHAAAFGLPAELPVSIGSGDNMMSALGAGATAPGQWVLSLGTSGTIFGPTAEAVHDPRGEVAPFRDALGGGLPLVCTQNCSSVVEEARRLLGGTHEELTAAATALPWQDEDPLFLPYLTGERTPNWPQATGMLADLRPGGLEPARLYRAALEGASLALIGGLARLEELGLAVEALTLVGGGARNPLWAQLLADLGQRPVQVHPEGETAARGAAVQAAWAVAGIEPAALAVEATAPPLAPDPAAAPRAAARRARFEELGRRLFG